MSIEKIIKRYFIFVMFLSAVAFASANGQIDTLMKNSYASAIHALESAVFGERVALEKKEEVVGTRTAEKADLTVDLQGGTFGRAGEKGVAVMELSLHGGDEVLELAELEFQVSLPEVEAMYLSDGGEYWVEGRSSGDGVWRFSGLDREIAGNLNLGLIVDLGADLKPGDRLRIDLVGAGDLRPTLFLRGKYVTIVR